MEERLLLNRVALHPADVSPRHLKASARVEPHFADTVRALRNRALVAARVAAETIVSERLN